MKGFFTLICSTLMGIMGVNLIVPVIPSIAISLNVTGETVSLIIAMFAFPGILFSPVIGMISDKIDRKKVLIISLTIYGVFGGCIFFVNNFQLLLFLRFIQGISAVGLMILPIILIGDFYTGVEKVKRIGINVSALGFGTAVFPFIGGMLGSYGWNVPFLLFFTSIFIAALASGFLENVKLPTNRGRISTYLMSTFKHLKNVKALIILASSIISFILLYGGILTYFSLYLGHNLGLSPFLIGVLLSITGLIAAVTSTQIFRLAGTPYFQIILLGSILCIICFILIPLSPTILLLFIPIIFFGVGQGLIVPTLHSEIISLGESDTRGFIVSILNMTIYIGQTIGPIILGIIFAYSSIEIVFVSAALIGLLTPILILTLVVLKFRKNNGGAAGI
ncbi:MAG: MFS transporter [Candidatus Odinarchaeia archaeon]